MQSKCKSAGAVGHVPLVATPPIDMYWPSGGVIRKCACGGWRVLLEGRIGGHCADLTMPVAFASYGALPSQGPFSNKHRTYTRLRTRRHCFRRALRGLSLARRAGPIITKAPADAALCRPSGMGGIAVSSPERLHIYSNMRASSELFRRSRYCCSCAGHDA